MLWSGELGAGDQTGDCGRGFVMSRWIGEWGKGEGEGRWEDRRGWEMGNQSLRFEDCEDMRLKRERL